MNKIKYPLPQKLVIGGGTQTVDPQKKKYANCWRGDEGGCDGSGRVKGGEQSPGHPPWWPL